MLVNHTWIIFPRFKIFAYQTSFQEDLDKSFLSVHSSPDAKEEIGQLQWFNDWHLFSIVSYVYPSMVCHDVDMNIFLPASFVKFLWHYWTEFSQSWKDLRKTLRSHENFLSLTDLINGANIYSFKFNWRLVILNVHDVKNESINEQEHAILEKCVNSILYFLKK